MLGFTSILLGMFSIGVMQLILATALPLIITQIGGSDLYGWVFSSYMLASLATIPLFSKLADIYGKKKFYILGMGIFAAGTLYGGFAPSMPYLIAARVIQGAAAGIITPITLAMISDMFPEEKRGNMIGLFSFIQLLSNLLSPPLGSFITKHLGWHWIFFLIVGMIILAMLLFSLGNRYEEHVSSMKVSEIDIIGGLIFGAFCVFTVGFSNTINNSSKSNNTSIIFLMAAVISAAILVLNEKRHENPVIKVEFLKTKIIRRSLINALLAGAIMYGLVNILPLCGTALNKQGYSMDGSSILLLFMIGITTGLLLFSRLVGKIKAPYITILLWILMSISSVFMVLSIKEGHLIIFNIFNALVGFSTGGIMATFMINSQNAISSKDRTVLSGLIQLGRYFGASIGVTVLTGMLPDIAGISGVSQFIGAFGVLIGISVIGFVNEMI